MNNFSNSDLRSIRLALGMTQQKLADILNVAQNYICLVETGKKPFSKKLVEKVNKLIEANTSTNEYIDDLEDPMIGSGEEPELMEIKYKIPVVGMAAAASYDPCLQSINELWEGSDDFTYYVGPNPKGAFALRITGDSMVPALFDGDIIAVRMIPPATGDICIVNHRTDGILCKRWYWRNRVVKLESINPTGKNYCWTKEEFKAEQPFVWRLKVEALIFRRNIAAGLPFAGQ